MNFVGAHYPGRRSARAVTQRMIDGSPTFNLKGNKRDMSKEEMKERAVIMDCIQRNMVNLDWVPSEDSISTLAKDMETIALTLEQILLHLSKASR